MAVGVGVGVPVGVADGKVVGVGVLVAGGDDPKSQALRDRIWKHKTRRIDLFRNNVLSIR